MLNPDMFWRLRKRASKGLAALNTCYYNFLLARPGCIFCFYYLVTSFLTFWVFYYHRHELSFNARMGFETRDTELSNIRLALKMLIEQSASKSEIIFGKRPRRSDFPFTTQAPPDSFTINYDDYGGEVENGPVTSPCQQYYALGGPKLSYNVIDALGKLTFEIASFDDLFNVSTLKRLCSLDQIIDKVVNRTELAQFVSPVPFSFHLPYYVFCTNMSYIRNCDALTSEHAETFKSLVVDCIKDPADHNCGTRIALQLREYILQRSSQPGQIPSGPILISAVTKVWNYFMVGANPDTIKHFYQTLMREMETEFAGLEEIKFKGAFFGVKEHFFEDALKHDVFVGVLAVSTVVVGIWLHSGSFLFTAIVFAGLLLATGSAFFIYSVVLGINFFPFVNLLVIVIAVAIGADDAFLLGHQFEIQRNKTLTIRAKLLNVDDWAPDRISWFSYSFNDQDSISTNALSSDEMTKSAVKSAVSHTSVAIFVTSATTAVAFLTNSLSPIVVLRCFGIFAALTVCVNFVFVVTGLPAALLLLPARPISSTSYFNFVSNFVGDLRIFYLHKLPLLVHRFKIPILFFFSICFVGSLFVLTEWPGIRLPETNSMQLLRSDHPFEWFEKHEMDFFNFSAHRSFKLNLYGIWGVSPTEDASSLIVQQTGHLATRPQSILTEAGLLSLNQGVHRLRKSNIVDAKSLKGKNSTWPERFLLWAKKCRFSSCCLTETNNSLPLSCPLMYSKDNSDLSKITADVITRASDTPVFEKGTLRLLGFVFQAPSRVLFSNMFSDLSDFFGSLSNLPSDDGFFVGTPDTTNLYDLLQSLLNDTFNSVLVAVFISGFVIIACTQRFLLAIAALIAIMFAICAIAATLLLLGWQINVVEATILVISIGLSFDYTLHLAVSFRLASDVVVTERAREANEASGIPILLATVTNISAGSLLALFAQTQSFFEIGVFLLVMAIISFVSAHGLFFALVFVFAKIRTI